MTHTKKELGILIDASRKEIKDFASNIYGITKHNDRSYLRDLEESIASLRKYQDDWNLLDRKY